MLVHENDQVEGRKTHHGDINNPNESGRVSQFLGNIYVLAGSISEPGEVGLMKPSSRRIRTTVV